jgi:hypothetical protein
MARFWWLGFDCGHCWDYQPGLVARLARRCGLGLHESRIVHEEFETYRTLDYAREQAEALARQIVRAGCS